MPLFMWSRADRGSPTITSRREEKLGPDSTEIIPLKFGGLSKPPSPCETHNVGDFEAVPGWIARPRMARPAKAEIVFGPPWGRPLPFSVYERSCPVTVAT